MFKNKKLMAALIFLNILCFKVAFAQTNQNEIGSVKYTSAMPEDLKKMLTKFSAALKKSDKSSAISMSNFPLKNIVYGEKNKKSKKEFESSLEFFISAFCYEEQNLENDRKSQEWVLDCNGNLFYFKKIKGDWKYVGYENINE